MIGPPADVRPQACKSQTYKVCGSVAEAARMRGNGAGLQRLRMFPHNRLHRGGLAMTRVAWSPLTDTGEHPCHSKETDRDRTTN